MSIINQLLSSAFFAIPFFTTLLGLTLLDNSSAFEIKPSVCIKSNFFKTFFM